MRPGRLFLLLALAGCAWAEQEGRIIMDRRPWPFVFELDVGQTQQVRRVVDGKPVLRTVRLVDVRHHMQPDYWCADNPDRQIFERACIAVEVDGQPATLVAGPYQSPALCNGLRLSVETTLPWARNATYNRMEDVERAVRLAAVAEGETWGPDNLRFPIRSFRWRASTYHNAWLQIVPYNKLYYHRGEDFGAIPDILEVVAPWDGTVTGSPLPTGDGRSNGVEIRHADGIVMRFAHMNIEHIPESLSTGSAVSAGAVIGRTGSTWDGRKSQHQDPHLHVDIQWDKMRINPYPFLVEAYFRDMPDAMLPNAGGYAFSVPGRPVKLDASRSLARPGRRIVAYTWHLQDGRTVDGPTADVTYDQPGLYSEALTIRTDDGSEDRDFLQVRVFDPARGRHIAVGWVHMTPGRGLRPGTSALFWNRLSNVRNCTIDFGDGSPPGAFGAEAQHAYGSPGLYTITVSATGPAAEPVMVRLRVTVESP